MKSDNTLSFKYVLKTHHMFTSTLISYNFGHGTFRNYQLNNNWCI